MSASDAPAFARIETWTLSPAFRSPIEMTCGTPAVQPRNSVLGPVVNVSSWLWPIRALSAAWLPPSTWIWTELVPVASSSPRNW